MAPVSFLDVKPGEKILDLCAAPGGKSTQIAVAMKGQGILVTNEINRDRAKILSLNIERLGIKNALVTNETPQHLSEVFHGYFDKILVDAPCSGEGMFRKNEIALSEWSPDNVLLCAERQKEILDNAMTEANSMKSAAVQYTDQLLAGVEDIITQSIDVTSKSTDDIVETIKQNSINMVKEISQSTDSVLSALTQYGEVIKSNRADLRPPEAVPTSAPASAESNASEEQSQGISEQEALNLDMLNG